MLAGCSQAAEPATTTVTTTAPAEDLDVLILGDSVTAELAQPLEAALGDGAGFLLQPHLPRTPGETELLRQAIAERDPEVIVFQVGHWERLKVLGDFAAGELLEPGTYRAGLVDPTLALLRENGARVVWVSPIPIEDAEESAFVADLAEDFEAAATSTEGVEWLDVRPAITPDGYTAMLDGEQVRRDDGIHLCPAGQLIVAEEILAALGSTATPTTTEAGCGPYQDRF